MTVEQKPSETTQGHISAVVVASLFYHLVSRKVDPKQSEFPLHPARRIFHKEKPLVDGRQCL